MLRWASRRCCCFVRSKHGVRQICPLRHLPMDNPQRAEGGEEGLVFEVCHIVFQDGDLFKSMVSAAAVVSPRSGCHASQGAAPAGTDRAFSSGRRSGTRGFAYPPYIAVAPPWPGALRVTGFCPARASAWRHAVLSGWV